MITGEETRERERERARERGGGKAVGADRVVRLVVFVHASVYGHGMRPNLTEGDTHGAG